MLSTTQKIYVNGLTRPFTDQTLAELLSANGFDPTQSGFAVAVNAVIARRTEWDAITLHPEDRVEIIQAAAGG